MRGRHGTLTDTAKIVVRALETLPLAEVSYGHIKRTGAKSAYKRVILKRSSGCLDLHVMGDGIQELRVYGINVDDVVKTLSDRCPQFALIVR